MDSKEKALAVLSVILAHLVGGNDPLHGGALLFDDDRPLTEHVREAVAALCDEYKPWEPVVPRSRQRRVGMNPWTREWNGYIGKRKQKVISFGLDRVSAFKWLDEIPLDILDT